MELNNLNSYDIDILTEIGNIGVGNAATALSEMLQDRVEMSVPKVNIQKFNELINQLNGPENIIAAILIEMHGALDGFILFSLENEYAINLLKMLGLSIEEHVNVLTMSDYEKSSLKEITNILTGSYITAICELTGLSIDVSVPALSVDMVGAILNVPISFYGQLGESVLLVESEFASGDDVVVGQFMLIPDLKSYETLLNVLRNGVS